MNKKLLLIALTILFINVSRAQVEDVSVIISPTAGYNFFDKKSTIEDGIMYGLQAGFGFGKVVELRGIYERSANLKQNFGKYESDIQDIIPGFAFANRSVTVTRYGGEFKTNIPAGGFAPYILLGTGVQKFEREVQDEEKYKSENLYGTGGLGIKINMGSRNTLNLEGRGIVYNMDPKSVLYNESGNSQFDDWVNSQKPGQMFNWSVQAALQFYLGGRDESDLSALDKAYRNRFSGGLSSAKLTLSPMGAYADFNSSTGFRNTYMLGGTLGIDFTNFVGLRAYYLQATKNEKISFDFDKLAMYGLDFIGNLNVARGIVPYITVGGGYLNVQDGYQGKNIGTTPIPLYQEVSSGYYAKGGAGITLPLGQYLDAFGAANVFYTMDNNETNVADLKSADELKEHTMFNVGLRLKLGKSARTKQATEQEYDNRFSDERSVYEQKIKSLDKELQEALKNNDSDKAIKLIEEKKAIEKNRKMPVQSSDSLIRMTPAELESLIEKTLKGIDEEESKPSIEKRLDRMEQLLINLKENNTVSNSTERTFDIQEKTSSMQTQRSNVDTGLQISEINLRLVDEINKLKQELKSQNANIKALEAQQALDKNQRAENADITAEIVPEPQNRNKSLISAQSGSARELSIFVGPNFGDATSFNAGIRLNYPIGTTRFIFMPEAYVALGKTTGFGLNANAVYPFGINNPDFTPYAGLGAGINDIGSNFNFNTNVILGTTYHLGNSNLFADYTIRGAFRNNQVALGYRFRM